MVAQDTKKIARLLKLTEEEVKRVGKINPTELANAVIMTLLGDILTELKKLNKKGK